MQWCRWAGDWMSRLQTQVDRGVSVCIWLSVSQKAKDMASQCWVNAVSRSSHFVWAVWRFLNMWFLVLAHRKACLQRTDCRYGENSDFCALNESFRGLWVTICEYLLQKCSPQGRRMKTAVTFCSRSSWLVTVMWERPASSTASSLGSSVTASTTL